MPARLSASVTRRFARSGSSRSSRNRSTNSSLRQGEAEIVLTLAVRAAFRAAAHRRPAGRGMVSPSSIFLVAWQQMVADAALASAAEGWLVNALRRQRDLASLIGVLDAAVGRALMHRLADQRLARRMNRWRLARLLPPGLAAVNDVHRRVPVLGAAGVTRPASPAYTTPRAGGPAVPCSRGPPSARRTRRASSRCRYPSSSRS